ncbi:trans-sialidase, putative, partial [Trypanosoma cruzi marinkellei]
EKKKGSGKPQSLGMVSVLLTEQLKRVKEVLETWKKVDDTVSQLCSTSGAAVSAPIGTACSTNLNITAGLVGFLSGNFSGKTWSDEYLGVNATVTKDDGAELTDNGVQFQGAWAEWPVGAQGENQLYHFANYNFTLVATVSIQGELKKGTIPVMGVRLDGGEEKLMELSYNSENNKWNLLPVGEDSEERSSTLATGRSQHVVILIRNDTQGSAYVDGQSVGNAPFQLTNANSKEISHFYIEGMQVGQEAEKTCL